MATDVNFTNTSAPREVGVHRVYTRETWDGEWTEQSHLVATQTVWACLPSMPVAVLEWRYGSIKHEDETEFDIELKDTAEAFVGLYVKIVHDIDRQEDDTWTTRTWYGVIADVDDSLGGSSRDLEGEVRIATGEVSLRCYGMEYLLNRHVIDNSWFDTAIAFENKSNVKQAFAFNSQVGSDAVYPNRSVAKPDGRSYVFSGRAPESGFRDTWSTYDIIEYLLEFQTPLNANGERAIVWTFEPLVGCPADWDTPQLQTEGRTTYSLLTQLLDRRRMCVAWFEIDPILESVMVLKIDSVTPESVSIGINGAVDWPANTNQVNILADTDPMTEISIRTSETPIYDAVIVRGDRIICVGSFSFDGNEIDESWEPSLQAEYEAAASGSGYNGQSLGKDRKQRLNDVARQNPRFADVFSKFEIPSDWDQEVNGHTQSVPLFQDNGDNQIWHCWSELFLDQLLPLYVGIDYSGSEIPDGTVKVAKEQDTERLRPLVFFKTPDKGDNQVDDRWVKADGMGADGRSPGKGRLGLNKHKANTRVSVDIRVPYHSRHFLLSVKNAPQHAIAKTDFSPIAGTDRFEGWWDYRDMVVTLSITSQMWVEGRWPAADPVKDNIAYKIIDAGSRYTATYVTPGTVVDVNATTGALVESDGGWIPKQDPREDNFAVLTAIAKVAANWYTVPHRICRMNTLRLRDESSIKLGQLWVSVGEAALHEVTANSVVTQVAINVPNNSIGPNEPLMQVTTWAGEMHPDLDHGRQVIQDFDFGGNPIAGGEAKPLADSPGITNRDPRQFIPGADSGGLTNRDPRQYDDGPLIAPVNDLLEGGG